MKKSFNYFSYLLIGTMMASAIFTVSSCKKENTDVLEVASITGQVDGKSWESLASDWWTQFYSVPFAKNPAFNDKTGALQPVGTAFGNTVFLYGSAGDTVKRTVTIKKGQYIFAPLINFTTWYIKGDTCDPTFVPDKGQSDLDFLKGALGNILDKPLVLTATLDGVPLYTNTNAQRVKNGTFEAIIHPDYTTKNCDWRPKKAISYADGYWIAFKPTAGKHTLVIGGKIQFPDKSTFANQVTFTLNVE